MSKSNTRSLDSLGSWVGRSEERSETITAAPLIGLSATLDRANEPEPAGGSAMPALAHWLYFLPDTPQSEIGVGGHPMRGTLLPPVPLPHRMWAGDRLSLYRDLLVGIEAVRKLTVTRVEAKEGRSGPLVFVTARHQIRDLVGLAIDEEHDIVYRDNPSPCATSFAPVAAPTDETFSRTIVPNPVLLFRYSALTFNGHRIHYDRPYVTEVEGYPGLGVHGPLIATLLLDLVRREQPDARLKAPVFKAASPLFDIDPFAMCGRREAGGVALWARSNTGNMACRPTPNSPDPFSDANRIR
jgi:3-methylfumaryl-CoA hydratase